jgi:YD repeat-containing protein
MNEAEVLLNSYGVTMQDASDFVMENIENISYVHGVAKDYGVTNDMLAEILYDQFPGLTGQVVANYFASKGIDSSDLGGTPPNIPVVDDSMTQSGTTNTDLGIGFPLYLKTQSTYTVFDNDTGNSNDTVINIKYTYDATTGKITDDNPENPTTYTYNSDGKLVSAYSEMDGEKDFSYDSQGRLLQEVDTFNQGNKETTTFTYDDENGFVTIKSVDTLSNTQETGQGALGHMDDTHSYYIDVDQINWDDDNDGIVDQTEYYTYDQRGDILTQKVDSDVDGHIDYQYTYEWGLFS